MSIRIMNWVWECSPAKGAELLLLLAIADFSDDEGFAYPKIPTLAVKTRLSRSSVIRAIESCERKKYLSREKGGGRAHNGYRVLCALSGVNLTPQDDQGEGASGVDVTPQQSQNDTSGVSERNGSSVTGDTAAVSAVELQGTTMEPPLNERGRASAPRTPKAAPKRGTRLPEDFRVSTGMREWFDENIGNLVDGRRETEKFRNYWKAATGRNATKLDWEATWKNWMLRAADNR